ncbi:MAG: DNA replication/repair protein RecF, partial [Gemmiger sp.]
MQLNKLKITDHRNIVSTELVPDPRLTVLCGANGQGKTNLLEAIWLLTGGKSFRGAKDAELIRRGAEFSVLEAEFDGEGRSNTLRYTVGSKTSQRPGRGGSLNGADYERSIFLAGHFTAVVFEPNHLSLVKAGPESRRRFLDTTLCEISESYLLALRRYTRLLGHKNAVLRTHDESRENVALVETFNDQMARYGGLVMKYRRDYLAKLAPAAAENYRDISSGAESLTLRYLPSCRDDGDILQIIASLRTKLRAAMPGEFKIGFCLVGPHREDIEIKLNNYAARVYGSQGQQRSAVLAMKLAEATVTGAMLNEAPVMLLDDVLSELDDGRQTYL